MLSNVGRLWLTMVAANTVKINFQSCAGIVSSSIALTLDQQKIYFYLLYNSQSTFAGTSFHRNLMSAIFVSLAHVEASAKRHDHMTNHCLQSYEKYCCVDQYCHQHLCCPDGQQQLQTLGHHLLFSTQLWQWLWSWSEMVFSVTVLGCNVWVQGEQNFHCQTHISMSTQHLSFFLFPGTKQSCELRQHLEFYLLHLKLILMFDTSHGLINDAQFINHSLRIYYISMKKNI